MENEKLIQPENIPMNIIKISNEIMKNIESSKNYSDFFADKYAENSYKNFLENIVEYKYDYDTLLKILNDLKIKQKLENKITSEAYKIYNDCNPEDLGKEKENLASYSNSGKDKNDILFYEMNTDNKNYNTDINRNNFNDNQVKNYYNSDYMNNILNSNKVSHKLNNKSHHEENLPVRDINSDNKNSKTKNFNCDSMQSSKYNQGLKQNLNDNCLSPSKHNSLVSGYRRNKSMDLGKIHAANDSISYENPNFEKLLRNYFNNQNIENHSYSKEKKPFIRFTKVHGDFFDKNIRKKNRPPSPLAAYEKFN